MRVIIQMINSSFKSYFSILKDLREAGKVLHNLIEILFIAVAAFVAGADDFDEVVIFGQEREEWLRKYLELPNGIPSVHTFRRIFRMIDSKQFEKCFIYWVKSIARDTKGTVVAIDGKTARGAKEAHQDKSPIHIVSAWLNKNSLVLGQIKTNEKSNEITAIPELLDLLSIGGATVTMDAMGTQKTIAHKIIKDNGANYVLALKMNHENMYIDVETYFKFAISEEFKDIPFQYIKTLEKGHGRLETREYYLITDIGWLAEKDKWEGLKSIGMAVNKTIRKGVATEEVRYFLCSITNGGDFSEAVRTHWGIESMHWTLDVTFGEDKSRIRKESEPENTALLRKIALNLLKIEKKNDKKQLSYKGKRFTASLNENYLEKIMIDNILNY
jgi:predicted transposase YbfD/YdcC